MNKFFQFLFSLLFVTNLTVAQSVNEGIGDPQNSILDNLPLIPIKALMTGIIF